ncbi:MAG: adenylate/guanylate cyclase domain-containing protein [Leptolyngbya sp. DLM2.Bin15]|nr:MAG: adenylate/guanylate cyclase domain-containing protein [Leptolyngbya sp. DLM2.Bin15]
MITSSWRRLVRRLLFWGKRSLPAIFPRDSRSYRARRRHFMHRRLTFSLQLAIVAYGTFMLYTLLKVGNGLVETADGWLWMAAGSVLGLTVCWLLLKTVWGRQHPDVLFVATAWIITLGEQLWATINGFALPAMYSWTLVFLVLAAMIPVRWPLHLLTQAGVLIYYYGVNGLLGLTVPEAIAQDSRQVLYFFWFFGICNIAVYLYEKLQRSEFQALKSLRQERDRSERLLLNILPATVVRQLKQEHRTIAESFAEASVLFADVVSFTELSTGIPPQALVQILNEIFSEFDRLADKHALEKIKTIGDSYMVVGGLPVEDPEHLEAIAEMALDMQTAIAQFSLKDGQPLQIRIGINVGPVVAGVIGMKKFIYDLWGDTVNVASRMESQGIAGGIQVTEAVYQRLSDRYDFQPRGSVEIKGKGAMTTYLLLGPIVGNSLSISFDVTKPD